MAPVAQSAIANLKKAGLSDIVYVPGEQAYEAREESYWSLTPRLHPWAIVQPRNTDEVSKAVKALVKTPGCNFAIRSGGHMSWVGAGNNIEDGITIDLGLMNKTTYNLETKIASLQPGSRWTNVYDYVEKHGVMVAGGREGLVGVGGLLTGGGLTFYTCRYGLGCDQVANYEVVLADGSIVEANSTTNPDLFRVLKGGHNNFGIITRFDMRTFEAKDVFDGDVVFSKAAANDVIDAYVDFSTYLAKNPDSHVLAIWFFMPKSEQHIINLVLTNLDGVENPKAFEKFMAIPGGQPNLKKKSIARKVSAFLLPSGRQSAWLTLTFKVDAQVMRKASAEFENMTEKLRKHIPDSNFNISMVFQPLLASWSQHSVARGGNILGLEQLSDDCVVLVTGLEVETVELLNEVATPALKEMFAEIEACAKSLDKLVDFLYLNYCDGSQNPLRTYGEENIKRMKEASAKYDPTGVFQERVPGGYKISKVK
ncbi:FAD-binding domain-containing protein [Hypomontagnella submonticulosa]|nr:FAD-binding domain-containing protein [Hypomontagnella submonticulosa]